MNICLTCMEKTDQTDFCSMGCYIKAPLSVKEFIWERRYISQGPPGGGEMSEFCVNCESMGRERDRLKAERDNYRNNNLLLRDALDKSDEEVNRLKAEALKIYAARGGIEAHEALADFDKGKEPVKEILYSGQCCHQIPIGQHCEGCGR